MAIKEQRFSSDNWENEKQNRWWHCYICHNCKLIRWHALSYCNKCGSRLSRMVGPTEELQSELYKEGFTESGM